MALHPQTRLLLWINVIGGAAVLGSYAHGLLGHPDMRAGLWGGVPMGVRPLYDTSMVLAAAGYFAFTPYFLFRIGARHPTDGPCRDLGLINGLYALVLLPSALWMPLTFVMLEQPSPLLWLVIRVVLAVVGLASLGLLAILLRLRPSHGRTAHTMAVVGLLAFSFQTAVLDAVVWPAYFPG